MVDVTLREIMACKVHISFFYVMLGIRVMFPCHWDWTTKCSLEDIFEVDTIYWQLMLLF